MLLDELGDEVAVRSVPIRHCAEPVALQGTRLQLVLSGQCFALASHLRDEDRVLVDLRLASSAHVSSHRILTVLLHDKAARGGLVNGCGSILLNEVASGVGHGVVVVLLLRIAVALRARSACILGIVGHDLRSFGVGLARRTLGHDA